MRAFGLGLFGLLCLTPVSAVAATITVNPGQSINARIQTAAAGDTVIINSGTYIGGIDLDRGVAVRAIGSVVVQASTPRSGTALRINCSDCSVTGVVFQDFGSAIWSASRNRVTIRNTVFRRSGTAWVQGDAWLIEGCEFDRPTVNGQPAGDGDYMNLWGTNHTLRRCFFHGLNLNTDMPPGAHNDGIQFFTEGSYSWMRLKNILIEECIYADYVQGIWISNNSQIPNAIENITIKNCVFWGQNFTVSGQNYTSPHGVMFHSHIPGVRVENNIFRRMWNNISLYSTDSIIIQKNIFVNSGNVYSRTPDMSSSAINRGTQGNILWDVINYLGPNGLPDRTLNPQLQNVNSVVGPDGIPWTEDDGWRSMNAAASGYGPQLELNGALVPVPPFDSDQDLLPDDAETDTGTFVDPNNTGSDPNDPDTDDDGVMDGIEVSLGTDPNNPLDFPQLTLGKPWFVMGIMLIVFYAAGLRISRPRI